MRDTEARSVARHAADCGVARLGLVRHCEMHRNHRAIVRIPKTRRSRLVWKYLYHQASKIERKQQARTCQLRSESQNIDTARRCMFPDNALRRSRPSTTIQNEVIRKTCACISCRLENGTSIFRSQMNTESVILTRDRDGCSVDCN